MTFFNNCASGYS